MSLQARWLGVAGLEFTNDGTTLLIDPFLSRPSFWALLSLQRLHADAGLVARYIHAADYVLVTHPHHDHCMDVPAVQRQTGAHVYGSPNTCTLMGRAGVPAEHTHLIRPGDRLELGPFTVSVCPRRHTRTPLDRWINGPLSQNARAPFHFFDYRMDACYSFHIQVGGRSLLVGSHAIPADDLFISPYRTEAGLAELLRAVRPRRVIPIHWDDFMRPLAQPLRPMLVTAAQGLSGFPPVRRLDLAAFRSLVQKVNPGTEVLIPGFNQPWQIQV